MTDYETNRRSKKEPSLREKSKKYFRHEKSPNQNLNRNENQFNSDYDRRNRNIIHENSYQRVYTNDNQ